MGWLAVLNGWITTWRWANGLPLIYLGGMLGYFFVAQRYYLSSFIDSVTKWQFSSLKREPNFSTIRYHFRCCTSKWSFIYFSSNRNMFTNSISLHPTWNVSGKFLVRTVTLQLLCWTSLNSRKSRLFSVDEHQLLFGKRRLMEISTDICFRDNPCCTNWFGQLR